MIDFKIKIHDVSKKHFKKKMQLEYDILDMQQYHKMNANIYIQQHIDSRTTYWKLVIQIKIINVFCFIFSYG